MEEILNKNPKEICIDILKQINNENVKFEMDDSSRTSLYVFLTNTIIISNKKVKTKKSIDEQNKSKLLVTAHECAHSIQPKIVQWMNFVLTNLEIIMFLAILFITFILKYTNPILNYIYLGLSLFSIAIRHYLEMDATIKSVKITSKYLQNNGVEKDKIIDLVKYYKKQLLKTVPLFVLSLYITKIARLMIVLVI